MIWHWKVIRAIKYITHILKLVIIVDVFHSVCQCINTIKFKLPSTYFRQLCQLSGDAVYHNGEMNDTIKADHT